MRAGTPEFQVNDTGDPRRMVSVAFPPEDRRPRVAKLGITAEGIDRVSHFGPW